MKILSEEKSKVLAERNGWSATFAEGYLEGESFRRRGTTPSKYAQVGIDDYSLGFRAGFYERRPDLRIAAKTHAPATALGKVGRS